jgi:hypothetical protein
LRTTAEFLAQNAILFCKILDFLLQHPSEPHRKTRCQDCSDSGSMAAAGLSIRLLPGRLPCHLSSRAGPPILVEPPVFSPIFTNSVFGDTTGTARIPAPTVPLLRRAS